MAGPRALLSGAPRLVAANAGARVAALVSLSLATFVIARAGGPTAVGVYALLRVLPGLLGVIASAGLPGAIAYFLAGPARADRHLPQTICAIALVGGAVGTAVWFAATPLVGDALFPSLSWPLVLLAGVTVLTQLIVATAKSCSQGSGDLLGANIVIVNEEFMFLPAYGLLWLAGIRGSEGLVAALLIADIATFVPAWIRLTRRGYFRDSTWPSVGLGRSICGYGLRAQVGGVITLLNLRLDFVILNVLAGPAVLGIYAIASKFAELLKIPGLSLTYVLYPEYSRLDPAEAAARARSLMKKAGAAIALAVVPLWLAAGFLIPAIYGRAFDPAVTPARIIIVGLVLEGVAGVITAFLYGIGRPGLNSWGVGAGLAITVVLDLALIPHFGARGAAVASAVAYIGSTLALLWLFRRVSEPSGGRPAGGLGQTADELHARVTGLHASLDDLQARIEQWMGRAGPEEEPAGGGLVPGSGRSNALIVLVAGVVLLTAAGASPARSAATGAAPGKAPRYRYLIDSGGSQAQAASYGWNLLDVGSKAEADALPRGTRGLVWVGDYDNASCSWQVSDAGLRQQLAGTARDRKIAGFFFSDEPDPNACPSAPAQHRARSQLIHALDPKAFTVMVMDSNSGAASLSQIPLWVGAADYVGLDPYPCYTGKACDYGWITSVVRAADRAGLPYWGVVQAFAGESWRWPTAAEERHMLEQWRSSREAGYMTFAWRWGGHVLGSRPGLVAVLKHFNRGAPLAPGRRTASARATVPVDEVHYTYTGPTSVAFDWRSTAGTIRYGRTRHYGKAVAAHTPSPLPFSSKGPFWEARLDGLKPATTYHYSIGGGADGTFSTAPKGAMRFDVEGDVGASSDFSAIPTTERQIASDHPAFVLVVGDLTYGNDNGQAAVDRAFDDVMVWSRRAAYMPAWGNHEWDESTDDLRNYKGRFAIPHPSASPGAPSAGCCGEDWGWFDAGGVRFISYPEPYSDATWPDWQKKAGRLMAAAQADPKIHFIVTFGHRPAYSTGYHPGDETLASIMNTFGDRYSKYVLNLNGHSHDYERFKPIHHVVHITSGSSASLEPPWSSSDPRTAYRALHLAHLRVDVTATALRITAICGPPISHQDTTCAPGSVIDSTTIPAGG